MVKGDKLFRRVEEDVKAHWDAMARELVTFRMPWTSVLEWSDVDGYFWLMGRIDDVINARVLVSSPYAQVSLKRGSLCPSPSSSA